MMNRKLAHGRHVEWVRASAHFNETDPGEQADLQLKRSAQLVHRLLQATAEGRVSRNASPWPTPGA